MKLKLYKNYSDNIVVDKHITQIGSERTGTLRAPCSVIDPVIEVQGLTNISELNYAYIHDYGRYYYINNIVCVSDKLFELYMHVDVLKTYASGIRGNNAVISRQQQKGHYDLMLADGTYKVKANPNFEIKKFPSGFSGHHYILIVAGK